MVFLWAQELYCSLVKVLLVLCIRETLCDMYIKFQEFQDTNILDIQQIERISLFADFSGETRKKYKRSLQVIWVTDLRIVCTRGRRRGHEVIIGSVGDGCLVFVLSGFEVELHQPQKWICRAAEGTDETLLWENTSHEPVDRKSVV